MIPTVMIATDYLRDTQCSDLRANILQQAPRPPTERSVEEETRVEG
jgi:hypothetical protein